MSGLYLSGKRWLDGLLTVSFKQMSLIITIQNSCTLVDSAFSLREVEGYIFFSDGAAQHNFVTMEQISKIANKILEI